MQCLEVSGAVRLIYKSLGVKGLSVACMFMSSTRTNSDDVTFLRYNLKVMGQVAQSV